MRKFEITWFADSVTGLVGVPHTVEIEAVNYTEAKTKFDQRFPNQNVWSWCELS